MNCSVAAAAAQEVEADEERRSSGCTSDPQVARDDARSRGPRQNDARSRGPSKKDMHKKSVKKRSSLNGENAQPDGDLTAAGCSSAGLHKHQDTRYSTKGS